MKQKVYMWKFLTLFLYELDYISNKSIKILFYNISFMSSKTRYVMKITLVQNSTIDQKTQQQQSPGEWNIYISLWKINTHENKNEIHAFHNKMYIGIKK